MPMLWKMLIASAIKLLLLVPLTFAKPPAGLENVQATCFLNALISCLYQSPLFRETVYRNFNENVVMSTLGGVFARLQVNNIPSLNTKHDLMRLIENSPTSINFGEFQDAEELFRLLFNNFPLQAAQSLGVRYYQETWNERRNYVFSVEPYKNEPLLIISIPDTSTQFTLPQLVDDCIFKGDPREWEINRNDHREYFAREGVVGSYVQVQGFATKTITRYSDFLPIFFVRMNEQQRPRKVEVKVDAILRIRGAPFEYHLVSFAVFKSKHYYSYALSNADGQWYLHNDSRVTRVSPQSSAFREDLNKRATCLFFARQRIYAEPAIPPILEHYAFEANKLQHLHDYLESL